MKRKITLLALVLVVVVLSTSVLFACNKETNDGKYYLYEDGVKDENSWIEIKGNKWIDDAGDGGTFEEKGGSLEFYDENGEWICSGKVSNGVLVIESLLGSSEYRKDGVTGSSDDKSQQGNTDHNIVGGICENCGVTAYTREGSYIYFGIYPQSKVTDSALKSTLTGSAGALPTSSNSGSWTSYGYYIDGSVSNFMWYIDKEYDGEKYRGVYFTSYRPCFMPSSSSFNSGQDDNGYSTGNVYWFKYEPIKWRMLSENDGKALMLAELILDSQEFYPSSSSHTENGKTIYANNWEYSTIRKWLNETFYNVAFNDLQKALIVGTELDNKTTAHNGSSNSYATCQNNTTDKVFLLSYKDMLNPSYGFSSSSGNYDTAMLKKTSDYAQVQGAYTSTDSSFLGNGWWWLRSPNSYDSDYAFCVHFDGGVVNGYVSDPTRNGVVPALTIILS
ncbi:MAG: hypothetical protein IJD50_07515 [Clostridia bacterium]|nr:hypothetical protein [Clostridia bacterium]